MQPQTNGRLRGCPPLRTVAFGGRTSLCQLARALGSPAIPRRSASPRSPVPRQLAAPSWHMLRLLQPGQVPVAEGSPVGLSHAAAAAGGGRTCEAELVLTRRGPPWRPWASLQAASGLAHETQPLPGRSLPCRLHPCGPPREGACAVLPRRHPQALRLQVKRPKETNGVDFHGT